MNLFHFRPRPPPYRIRLDAASQVSFDGVPSVKIKCYISLNVEYNEFPMSSQKT